MHTVALFCYDVRTTDKPGRRRLAKVAKLLERYGTRVQFSVFEVRMNAVAINMIRDSLAELMDLRVDSLRIYRVEELSVDKVEHLGKKPDIEFMGQMFIF